MQSTRLHLFPALRAAQLVFALIELGLVAQAAHAATVETGYCVGLYPSDTCSWHQTGGFGITSQIAFLLFSATWTLISTVAGLVFARTAASRSLKYEWITFSTTALDALNMVFWLAGFAAFAAYYGIDDGALYQGIVALAVLEWLFFLATLLVSVLVICGKLQGFSFGLASRHQTITTFVQPSKPESYHMETSMPGTNIIAPPTAVFPVYPSYGDGIPSAINPDTMHGTNIVPQMADLPVHYPQYTQ